MPVPGSQILVTAAAVQIIAPQQHAQNVYLKNAGSTNSAFLGQDATVTATGGGNPGFELLPGASTPNIQFDPNEAMFAVCGAGLTTRVDVIQSYSA